MSSTRNRKISRILAVLFALLATALIVASCSDDDPAHEHEVTLNGSGFDAYAGKPVTVAVVHAEDGDVEATEAGTVAADGTFSLTVHDAVLENQTYSVDFYTDSDSDGHCDMAEGDGVWRYDLSDVDGDQVIEVTHDSSSTMDVCSSFSSTEDGHSH